MQTLNFNTCFSVEKQKNQVFRNEVKKAQKYTILRASKIIKGSDFYDFNPIFFVQKKMRKRKK